MAVAAGVQVMLGSDIPPFSDIDGTSATVRELEHMAAFGLPPRDALLAATQVPAAWLGIDRGSRFGRGREARRPHRDEGRPDAGGVRAAHAALGHERRSRAS